MQDWTDRGLERWQIFRNWATQQILWDYSPSVADIEDVTDIDGRGDKGIDGWFYDDTDTPPRLILIQSKVGDPKREDLSKARDGFLDLMLPNRPGTASASLREKAAILKSTMPDRLNLDIYLATAAVAPQNLQPKQEGDPLYPEQFQMEQTLVTPDTTSET